MTIDLIVTNKIVKNNKAYSLPMKTTMKTITIVKITLLKINMKIVMEILYNISMKTIQMNIPPQNLKLQHKMHHKLAHQQTANLLEFQLGLLFQDQIRITHNQTLIHLHGASLLSTFPLIQMMKYKMKLKI